MEHETETTKRRRITLVGALQGFSLRLNPDTEALELVDNEDSLILCMCEQCSQDAYEELTRDY